ncbi:MAG: GntR family transcriptional regulator [Actinobacteria bacterium]|nr:GntR family transcriptional regulator [Actinomycetota bacterium]
MDAWGSKVSPLVDRGVAAPLHYQLREQLRRRIVAGEWKAGEAVPTETALTEEAGVSRSVVRQALGDLVREGLLERQQGVGTFVAQARITGGFAAQELGFHEDMLARGYDVSSRVRSVREEQAGALVAARLGLAETAAVVAIDRIRSVDGVPTVQVESWLPAAMFPGLVDLDLEDVSLYRILFERYGVRARSSRRVLTAALADEELATLLEVRVGAPLVELESVSYREIDGLPFEAYRAHHRGDRTRFEIDTTPANDLREVAPGAPASASAASG